MNMTQMSTIQYSVLVLLALAKHAGTALLVQQPHAEKGHTR